MSRTKRLSREDVLARLDRVKDPEVPVISVVELGIVRDVEVTDDTVTVTVTPTYSGCPAMHAIEQDIRTALEPTGRAVELRTVYSPAWTTDWLSGAAREKLERYGIAPPGPAPDTGGLITIQRRTTGIRCPFCKSTRTTQQSEFGSTACKAIWTCRDCGQPFEEFKAI